MIISIGSDHGGFLLKEQIKKYLETKGYVVNDKGCTNVESVHYPLYAEAVCEEVANQKCNYGILICTSGVGMCISANKVKGIRACNAHLEEEAMLCRSHNNCNVLCLGAKWVDIEQAKKIIDTFLETPFAGGRHQIRIDMIKKQEGN